MLIKKISVHQLLSICSSIVGMGWCLAAYQRAIRYAQQNKNNITWCGTILQVAWHFLVTCKYKKYIINESQVQIISSDQSVITQQRILPMVN